MEWMGYLAAVLVFCTFYMRTMPPLRWMAVASNVAFLGYAVPLHLWPIVILHGLLLPLNCLRLRQLYRMLANLRAATTQTIDVTQFLAHLTHHQHPAGAVLFSKGEPADCAYYIANGEVEIPERQIRLGAGQFFGEIGVFGSSGTRTGSAVCASGVTLYRISERDLISAFYQSPALAFALVQLIVDRLGDNLQRAEQGVAKADGTLPAPGGLPPVGLSASGPPSSHAVA
jgi:CRP/FNR family cyclic AMP-dependent transcriptional regulator